MKKIYFFILCSICTLSFSAAQDAIVTAGTFFQSLSEYYGTISDFEANMEITAGTSVMQGKVSFKKPNLLRIDFSNPESQVILFNGTQLTIYLPGSAAVLTQTVSDDAGTSSGANLATPQGLTLMSRYYSIAYLSDEGPVPLDDPEIEKNPSSEMVIKLKLTKKKTTEGFETIILSINPEKKLIRRVEAVTIANEKFKFTFTEYALNQKIPDTRFMYDSPGTANNYNNFLFSE